MLEDTVEEITVEHESVPLPDTPSIELEEGLEAPEVPESPDKVESSGSAPLIAPVALPAVPDDPKSQKKAKKVRKQEKRQKQAPVKPIVKRDQLNAYMTQERCRHLCLSIFFREQTAVRSLGFTSSVGGEGKSFLASISARSLASDSGNPVTLLECNWEHPRVHDYFGIASSPGLAEFLRGEADERTIRYQIASNLTVIPAGNGRKDAVKLLQQLRQRGSLNTLCQANELLIVDLPPVITTAYGALMASLVDALIVVVRAHVTPDAMVAETCSQLSGLPVEGLLLNQVESHIPRWLQRLL
jgi:protein-tyrosine kinase